MAGQLRLRREEIAQTVLAYVRDTAPDEIGDLDVEYALGLRAAVAAAVEYALTGIEQGDDWPAPIPTAAIVQARRAARGGVGLDTVLRRYIAGYTLLEDFVMDAVEAVDVADAPSHPAAVRFSDRVGTNSVSRAVPVASFDGRAAMPAP